MTPKPREGQHHQLEISGAQEGYFTRRTYLRCACATVIPFSLKFCEATCVFAHQKMRGVFARALLHHVVFPQPATPATIKEPLLDTCSSAKRQASCSCEPEKSSQGPTNSGTRCGIQVGKKNRQ